MNLVDKETPVHFGKGLNPILSNLYPHPITFRGETYTCIEGAYQSWKGGIHRPGYNRLTGLEAWRKSRAEEGGEGRDTDLLYELMQLRYSTDKEYRNALSRAGRITHPVASAFWREEFPKLLYRLRSENLSTSSA